MKEEAKANKKYKDSIFRRLFGEDRENALSFYEHQSTYININVGHNRELFEKCQVLHEYSIFIQKVRTYHHLLGNLDATVDRAVQECIEENVLKTFLEKQRREAINVCLTEFDEEKFENMLKEEGRAEGRAEGLVEGKLETLLELVKSKVISLEVALSMTSLSKEAFLSKLSEV